VLHRCCQLFSLNVPFTRRWWIFSVNPFVAFYIKGLPLQKRLATDAILKRFVRREDRCVDLSLIQQQIQKFTL
jgi:hypothetical protein